MDYLPADNNSYFLELMLYKWDLRGSLSKNRPLNFVWKIMLPETLESERLYQNYNQNRFALIHNNFLATLEGCIKYFVPPRPICTSRKLKIRHFLRHCKMFDLHHLLPVNVIKLSGVDCITKIGLLWFTIIFLLHGGALSILPRHSQFARLEYFWRCCKMFDLHHLSMNFISIYR